MKVQEALKAAIKELETLRRVLEHDNSDYEINLCKAALAEIDKCEPVAYLCRSKMTDYAISLLSTKIARETEMAKGWSDWHSVEVEKYKFYLNSVGKSDWLSDYEFIPLYTSPQPIEKCEPVYLVNELDLGWEEVNRIYYDAVIDCPKRILYTSPISK